MPIATTTAAPSPSSSHHEARQAADPSDPFEVDLGLAAAGDASARQRLWTEHYERLHEMVLAWFAPRWRPSGRRGDLSIGATHIVNELYERLHDRSAAFENGRAWFFKCFYVECARIFFDHLRRRKRHHAHRGEMPTTPVMDACSSPHELDATKLVLDELRTCDPLAVEIAWIKLLEPVRDERAPGGFRSHRNQEIADRLGVSLSLVEKRWKFAKAHLMAKLAQRAEG